MIPEIIQKEKHFLNSDHMGEFAEVGETRIHYYEQGEGEALLLIHTLGQSLYTWHKVISRFAETYRVIAVDLPGHGYSDKLLPDGDYTIKSTSDRLIGLMDALSIEKAHVCAFSMGALIALDIAERYPERTDRLVLISPGGLTPTMPYTIRSLDSSLTGWFAAATLSEKTVSELLTDAFFDQTLITREMVREYYLPLADKESRAALRNSLRAFNEDDVIASLRNVQNEVLIIWGVDDRWHEVAIAEIFHIALEQVEFALIRNCGHILHEEKPERFLEYALDFYTYGMHPVESTAL